MGNSEIRESDVGKLDDELRPPEEIEVPINENASLGGHKVRVLKFNKRQTGIMLLTAVAAICLIILFAGITLARVNRSELSGSKWENLMLGQPNSKLGNSLLSSLIGTLGSTNEITSTVSPSPSSTAVPSPQSSVSPTLRPSSTPTSRPISTPTATPSHSSTPVTTPSAQSGLADGTENQTTLTSKVLGIGYNPAQNGETVAGKYFIGLSGYSSSEVLENSVFSKTSQAFSRLSGGSLQFTVVKVIHVNTFPQYPDGFVYTMESYRKCVFSDPTYDASTCEQRKWQFDYPKWIKDNRICEIAKEVGADEIWMLSPPYIMAWENFMIGPDQGFDVNGANYSISSCEKHFVVVNGSYDRPTNVLHNIGHRIEASMRYLSSTWRSEDREKYWEKFAATKLYSGQTPSSTYCGNAHYPSNTSAAYDYSNYQSKGNNCADWRNFPDFNGSAQNISCSSWGCDDPGWQEFWMASIPRSTGKVLMQNQNGKSFYLLKNWWQYFLYPDLAINAKKVM